MTTNTERAEKFDQTHTNCSKALTEPEKERTELAKWLKRESEQWDCFGNKAVAKLLAKAAALLEADEKPVAMKPLSHGQFLDIWNSVYEPGHRDYVIAERVARAIEAAHGIKEKK